MKPVEYYKDREQTYLKHFFLERYLETVAYHIGYSQREFVYVDCFSGPWRAAGEDLADTSIRIALDRLNAVQAGLARHRRHPAIRAIFVEKSRSAFGALQQALEQHRGVVKTLALHGSFEEIIDRIAAEVGPAFGFFFVDPTGWTGFAMENLEPILRRAKCEVMINFMYDFINRFLNSQDTAIEESLDRCFGTRAWRAIREAPDREQEMLELYVDQVRAAGGFDYATYTRILKPLQERAYFHLVYATRSPKGIEKFRDVEKKVTQEQEVVRERAQREDREARSGQPGLFNFSLESPSGGLMEERARRRAEAESRIRDILSKGPVRFEQLQPRVLEIPLVWSTDVSEILFREHRAGRLVIEGLAGRERTAKAGCVIRKRDD